MRELLRHVIETLASGGDCVLCSLVETRGSTPQKPGATMVVFPDGRQAGTLGGGCVEAEVKQQAVRALDAGGPQLLTFHLDDNYGWDDGLICGGRMTVVAQPCLRGDQAVRGYVEALAAQVRRGAGCVEAILMEESGGRPKGGRVLFDETGRELATLHLAARPAGLAYELPDLSKRPRPVTRGGVAYLPHLPRIRLLIVGGGHVGQAVGKLAAEADFDVWVLDDREQFANRDRFPAAERLIVGDIGQTLARMAPHDVTPSTFAIIVTRGHAHDEEALYHLATTPAGFVGMIGSKRKVRLILDDLRAKGIADEALARVRAPLGLDIGSQTVPEIAVSIVAELIARRNLGPGYRQAKGD